MTDTRQSVTASGRSAWSVKPPNSRESNRDKVEELKRLGFTDPAMREWTLPMTTAETRRCKTARFYVEHWEDMKAGNIGYLLWGSVGTG